jgi:F0F1-type ATP synthase assembly protein I
MTGTPVGTPLGPSGQGGSNERGTSVGEYAGLGLQFAASIIVFLYLGQWLDRRLGTAPWLLLISVFVGAGASFYSMYRKLMAAQAREEAARRARRGDPTSGTRRDREQGGGAA